MSKYFNFLYIYKKSCLTKNYLIRQRIKFLVNNDLTLIYKKLKYFCNYNQSVYYPLKLLILNLTNSLNKTMSQSNIKTNDWCQENEDKYKGFILKPKCLMFDPEKKRVSVSHYLTIDNLRFRSDTDLDLIRKTLFKKGEYVIEDGEIFE